MAKINKGKITFDGIDPLEDLMGISCWFGGIIGLGGMALSLYCLPSGIRSVVAIVFILIGGAIAWHGIKTGFQLMREQENR